MKRPIVTYGIIAGLIVSVMMAGSLSMKDKADYDTGMVIGFTSMILAFSLIFFAIQSYKKLKGEVSFKQSLLIGLGITAIASTFYVITWLIVYYNFMPDFMEDYSAHYIEKMKHSGKSEAAIQAAIAEMEHSKELYKNPLYVVLFTFIEIVPVGLIVTFIAALVEKIRTKPNVPKTV